MRTLFIITLLAGFSLASSVSFINDINAALRSGDTSEFCKYLGSTVDLGIVGDQDYLSKEEAKDKISEFFSDKTTTGYEVIHKGNSKGNDSLYTIGILYTEQGRYKVYIFITAFDGEHFIEEVKIEY